MKFDKAVRAAISVLRWMMPIWRSNNWGERISEAFLAKSERCSAKRV